MNNIRLEKTEGYVKKKQVVEKTTKEGQTYYILTVTEEFATEKSVMLIATTTE